MRYDAGELTMDAEVRSGPQVVGFFVDDATENEEGWLVGGHLARLALPGTNFGRDS